MIHYSSGPCHTCYLLRLHVVSVQCEACLVALTTAAAAVWLCPCLLLRITQTSHKHIYTPAHQKSTCCLLLRLCNCRRVSAHCSAMTWPDWGTTTWWWTLACSSRFTGTLQRRLWHVSDSNCCSNLLHACFQCWAVLVVISCRVAGLHWYLHMSASMWYASDAPSGCYCGLLAGPVPHAVS